MRRIINITPIDQDRVHLMWQEITKIKLKMKQITIKTTLIMKQLEIALIILPVKTTLTIIRLTIQQLIQIKPSIPIILKIKMRL